MRRLTVALLALGASLSVIAGTATANVLRVGTYHGIAGQYRTIQAAVDAAKPGDWVLVATEEGVRERGIGSGKQGIITVPPTAMYIYYQL